MHSIALTVALPSECSLAAHFAAVAIERIRSLRVHLISRRFSDPSSGREHSKVLEYHFQIPLQLIKISGFFQAMFSLKVFDKSL